MNNLVKSLINCPQCMGALEKQSTSIWVCTICHQQYPVNYDIPDLRYPKPDGAQKSDLYVVEKLMSSYSGTSYDELIELYFSSQDNSKIPEHLTSMYKNHHHKQLLRSTQFMAMFLTKLTKYFILPAKDVALEIGCGTGSSLIHLSQNFENVIGIDPHLPSLIMAKKICDENNIGNVTLIQAYGECLPLANDCFVYTTAQNVLEHVIDFQTVMSEIARVLKPHGCFTADSRNRYDLLFPEPHVNIRWVGLLPRKWANKYVHWRIGMDYDVTHTILLSYLDIRKVLIELFGHTWKIVTPDISVYGKSVKFDRLINYLESIKWLYSGIVFFFPSHVVLAQKPKENFSCKPMYIKN